jgi:hypothetical protein
VGFENRLTLLWLLRRRKFGSIVERPPWSCAMIMTLEASLQTEASSVSPDMA